MRYDVADYYIWDAIYSRDLIVKPWRKFKFVVKTFLCNHPGFAYFLYKL